MGWLFGGNKVKRKDALPREWTLPHWNCRECYKEIKESEVFFDDYHRPFCGPECAVTYALKARPEIEMGTGTYASSAMYSTQTTPLQGSWTSC